VMEGTRPDPESCAAEKAHLPGIDEDDSD